MSCKNDICQRSKKSVYRRQSRKAVVTDSYTEEEETSVFTFNEVEDAGEYAQQRMEGTANGCPMCMKNFSSKRKLTYHLKSCPQIKCSKGEYNGRKEDVKKCKTLRSSNSAITLNLRATVVLKSEIEPAKMVKKNVREVEKIKSRTCEVCGKVFARSANVMLHMRLHRGEKPFRCSTCEKTFCRSDHLKNHELVHGRMEPFHCDLCSQTFKRQDHLKYHHINSHGAKIYLSELKSYTRTVQNVAENRLILCDICGVSFGSEQNLKNHLRIHSNEGKFSCQFCRKTFNQSSNLNIHLRKHTGETPYKCLTCDQSFTTSSKLKTHARKHTGDLPFTCEVCGRLFGESHLLKMHMRVHSDQRQYTCSHCSKTFTHGSTLRAHLRTHTGAKPYKCDQCGDAFAQVSSLTYHKRTHTGEKPYSCHICGNSYTRMATLNIHLTRHTGQKRISCPHCDFKCDTPKHLLRHEVKTHSQLKSPLLSPKQNHNQVSKALYAENVVVSAINSQPLDLENLNNLCSTESKAQEQTSLICGHSQKHPEDVHPANSGPTILPTLDSVNSMTVSTMEMSGKTETVSACIAPPTYISTPIPYVYGLVVGFPEISKYSGTNMLISASLDSSQQYNLSSPHSYVTLLHNSTSLVGYQHTGLLPATNSMKADTMSQEMPAECIVLYAQNVSPSCAQTDNTLFSSEQPLEHNSIFSRGQRAEHSSTFSHRQAAEHNSTFSKGETEEHNSTFSKGQAVEHNSTFSIEQIVESNSLKGQIVERMLPISKDQTVEHNSNFSKRQITGHTSSSSKEQIIEHNLTSSRGQTVKHPTSLSNSQAEFEHSPIISKEHTVPQRTTFPHGQLTAGLGLTLYEGIQCPHSSEDLSTKHVQPGFYCDQQDLTTPEQIHQGVPEETSSTDVTQHPDSVRHVLTQCSISVRHSLTQHLDTVEHPATQDPSAVICCQNLQLQHPETAQSFAGPSHLYHSETVNSCAGTLKAQHSDEVGCCVQSSQIQLSETVRSYDQSLQIQNPKVVQSCTGLTQMRHVELFSDSSLALQPSQPCFSDSHHNVDLSQHHIATSQHIVDSVDSSQHVVKNVDSSEPIVNNVDSSQPIVKSLDSSQHVVDPSQHIVEKVDLSQHFVDSMDSSQHIVDSVDSSQHIVKAHKHIQQNVLKESSTTTSVIESHSAIISCKQSQQVHYSTCRKGQIRHKEKDVKEKLTDPTSDCSNSESSDRLELKNKSVAKKRFTRHRKCESDKKKVSNYEENRKSDFGNTLSRNLKSKTKSKKIVRAKKDINSDTMAADFVELLQKSDHTENCKKVTDLHSTKVKLNLHPDSKSTFKQNKGRPFQKEPSRRKRGHITCNVCGQAFSRTGNLTTHMRLHSGERPYSCRICDKKFTRSDHLKTHLLLHKGDNSLVCNHCGDVFGDTVQLNLHTVEKHDGKNPFACSLCTFSCIYIRELKDHVRGHERKDAFSCGVCDVFFSKVKDLKKHMNSHDGQNPFVCTTCKKSFKESSCLKLHMRSKHTGEKHFKCGVCGDSYVTAAKLQRHIRIHSGSRPFACEFCGKMFMDTYLLKMHLRIHTNEKPFKCKHCEQNFTHRSTLRAHVRIHTGNKPYACDVCGASFVQVSSLTYHKRRHDGVKPYTCQICGNSYTRSTTLSIHMTRHTGQKRISCPQCVFKCDTLIHLRKHLAKVHNLKEPNIPAESKNLEATTGSSKEPHLSEAQEVVTAPSQEKQQTQLLHLQHQPLQHQQQPLKELQLQPQVIFLPQPCQQFQPSFVLAKHLHQIQNPQLQHVWVCPQQQPRTLSEIPGVQFIPYQSVQQQHVYNSNCEVARPVLATDSAEFVQKTVGCTLPSTS